MGSIFDTLNRLVEGSSSLALAGAFLWGLASVAFSPCHLASIPLIVGFVSGGAERSVRQALWTSILFALGVLGTIAVAGIVTAALGRVMGDIGGWANWVAAAIFFIFGLHLLDVVPLPFSGASGIGTRRRGYLAALIIGFVYGLALGPCTFAFMAPVLTVGFRVGATRPFMAGLIFLFFGLGHSLLIAAAGTSAGAVQAYLRWGEQSRALTILRRVCGVLVLLGGLYFIYSAR